MNASAVAFIPRTSSLPRLDRAWFSNQRSRKAGFGRFPFVVRVFRVNTCSQSLNNASLRILFGSCCGLLIDDHAAFIRSGVEKFEPIAKVALAEFAGTISLIQSGIAAGYVLKVIISPEAKVPPKAPN